MAITDIEDRITDIVENSDKNHFIYDFLSVYDFPKATITKLRKGINNLAEAPNEVYLKNRLYFKQVNSDLMQNFVDIKEKIHKIGAKPRYIIVTDFKNVLAEDTKTNDTLDVEFKRLPQKFEFFLAWNGIEKADFDKENPADIRAAERFAKLYDVVIKDNPDASRHGLNLFLIRVLFCLFAEDTDIFEKNLFTNRIKELTKEDGSDLDYFLKKLFGVLDVEKVNRSADTPSWLMTFPYVDGDLFKDSHESLKFTQQSRKLIIDAGEKLEWNQINPDILGSMIQAVTSGDSRSHLGMHYTSVPNIMKVIKPLFLDNLHQEFEKAKGNSKKLDELYDRIGKIKFMDPACGSGNFLTITYKELRQLEIDILKELNGMGIATMYVPSVTLDQFYGIEIDDFACDVTRLSLWIAEHQMNKILEKEVNNAIRPTLPLQHVGAIVCGNALRINWNDVLPHEKDDEVYLFGNPPYLGYSLQDKEQKKDIRNVFEQMKNCGFLDYISGWFKLAADYIECTHARCAFVTTNSIVQGMHVSVLWKYLLKKIQLIFAYKSFKWTNNAKNNAGVIVSVIGLCDKHIVIPVKRLYNSNSYREVSNISPYLTDGENTIVISQRDSIFKMPKMLLGNTPRDGGGLIFSKEEYQSAIGSYPELKPFFKFYIGSKELLNSKERYVLWLSDQDYKIIQQNDLVAKRVEVVRDFRLKSSRDNTRKLASKPYEFAEVRWKPSNTIVIPRVSSSNRLYAPIGFVKKNTVVADSANTIYDAPLWLMGILSSKMHMIWLKTVGGRLKNDYRYSAVLVYNTFPVPNLSTRRKNEIEKLVWKILDIRDEEGGTLAELYGSPLAEKNPKLMNPRLLAAH